MKASFYVIVLKRLVDESVGLLSSPPEFMRINTKSPKFS